MTDETQLLLVLAGLHGFESLTWVSQTSLVLRHGWRGARLVLPSAMAGNLQAGMVGGELLPTFGQRFVVSTMPFAMDGAGVTDPVQAFDPERPRSPGDAVIPFEQLAELEREEQKLLLGKRVVASCDTPHAAAQWHERLREWAALSPTERDTALDQLLAQRCDLGQLRDAHDRCVRTSRWLRGFETVLFLVLFVAVPIVLWRMGLAATWRELLAALGVAWLGCTAEFFRVHRRLFPTAPLERWAKLFMMLVLPVSALRASDWVSRRVLADFEPMIAAHAIAGDRARDWLRFAWRDLTAPPEGEAATPAGSIRSDFRDRLQRHIGSTLTEAGVSLDRYTDPPTPLTPSAAAFCPRCHSEFSEVDRRCPDCECRTRQFATAAAAVPEGETSQGDGAERQ